MKQKYQIFKSDKKNELIIKEYAETGKDTLSFFCESVYSGDKINNAIERGKEALISALRTGHFYPVRLCAEKLADTVIDLYATDNDQPVELLFDDKEAITPEPKEVEITDEPEDKQEALKDMLVEEKEKNDVDS